MLMPSHFEPCGLNQMYSLRYGAIPIVSTVGGHVDTVRDVEDGEGEGTGVLIEDLTAEGITAAARRAMTLYGADTWDALRRRAMQEDFSWKRSVDAYSALYTKLLERPRRPLP